MEINVFHKDKGLIPVRAYPVKAWRGVLAVHRQIDGQGWKITHVPTGFSAMDFRSVSSKAEAMARAVNAAALVTADHLEELATATDPRRAAEIFPREAAAVLCGHGKPSLVRPSSDVDLPLAATGAP